MCTGYIKIYKIKYNKLALILMHGFVLFYGWELLLRIVNKFLIVDAGNANYVSRFVCGLTFKCIISTCCCFELFSFFYFLG